MLEEGREEAKTRLALLAGPSSNRVVPSWPARKRCPKAGCAENSGGTLWGELAALLTSRMNRTRPPTRGGGRSCVSMRESSAKPEAGKQSEGRIRDETNGLSGGWSWRGTDVMEGARRVRGRSPMGPQWGVSTVDSTSSSRMAPFPPAAFLREEAAKLGWHPSRSKPSNRLAPFPAGAAGEKARGNSGGTLSHPFWAHQDLQIGWPLCWPPRPLSNLLSQIGGFSPLLSPSRDAALAF